MRRLLPVYWLVLGLVLASGLAHAADEPIAVIVAPGHAKGLKKDDLALIFKRKKLFWNDGSKVQPVNLPASNPLRWAFSLAVLEASPEDLEKYWNDMYFHGVSPPHVVVSEEAALRFVAETPGAIGYVPFCSADSRVAIVMAINGAGHVSSDPSSISCPR